MKNILLILLLVLVTIPATAVEARDRSRGGNDSGRRSRTERSVSQPEGRKTSVSSDQAAKIAERHFEGRVLDVKRDDGAWRVKMLNKNGEIRVLAIDEATGEMISPK